MSSQQPERYIILDDEDPSITYSGPGWFQDKGQDNVGVLGPPYLNTLHGTSEDGSVSLQFNGTLPRAFGSFYQTLTAPGAHVWQCSIDGVGFGHPTPPSGNTSGNNYLLCDGTKLDLAEGVHNFTIDINITSKSSTFWFDWIEYMPSPDASLDNTVARVDHDDPIIHYDASWQHSSGLLSMTTVPGSAATISFVGESASWYINYSPVKLFLAPATGSYSLDGGKQTQFTWQASESGGWVNQLLFTTPKVKQGHHNLTVTFLGSNGSSPLALDYLLIQNGTIQTPSPEPTKTQSNNLTGIIIGSVGGVVALGLIAAGFYYWRRRYVRWAHHNNTSGRLSFISSAGPDDMEAQNPVISITRRVEKPRRSNRDGSQSVGERSEPSSARARDEGGFESFVRHEDSGIRFHPADEEIPPSYTSN